MLLCFLLACQNPGGNLLYVYEQTYMYYIRACKRLVGFSKLLPCRCLSSLEILVCIYKALTFDIVKFLYVIHELKHCYKLYQTDIYIYFAIIYKPRAGKHSQVWQPVPNSVYFIRYLYLFTNISLFNVLLFIAFSYF